MHGLLGLDLNKDPGNGNLNVRAYIASIVGPRRIANSVRSMKQVSVVNGSTGSNTQLASNGTKIDSCVYVEVWLPQSALEAFPDGIWFGFSGGGANLEATADRVLLSPVPGQSTARYHTLLLPQEKLYAVAYTAGDGNALNVNKVPVVVGAVTV